MENLKEIKDFRILLAKKGIIKKLPMRELPKKVDLDINGVDYNEIDAIRNSELTYLAQSPAHWKAWKDGLLEDKEVFITGKMLHKTILEKSEFEKSFAIKQDARTIKGKILNESNAKEGKFLVSEKELSMIDSITKNLMGDKLIKNMFKGTIVEQNLIFSYKNLICKAKPDIFKPKKYCIDLKFVQEAKPEKFVKKAFSYDYHRQAAFYKLALEANKLASPRMKFFILAIEKTPPFAYSLIEISQGVMNQGLERVNLLLDRYKETVLKNDFSGYPNIVWNEI